jgi:hypothetical protein
MNFTPLGHGFDDGQQGKTKIGEVVLYFKGQLGVYGLTNEPVPLHLIKLYIKDASAGPRNVMQQEAGPERSLDQTIQNGGLPLAIEYLLGKEDSAIERLRDFLLIHNLVLMGAVPENNLRRESLRWRYQTNLSR